MIDGATREVWFHRALFLVLALVFLFIRLLPMAEASPTACAADDGWCRAMVWLDRMPGPDLLLCIILAWTMRRPQYLPTLLIAAVVLFEDLVLLRPPGLWTALVIIATEFIRSRAALTRELNFGVEWLLVTAMMLAMLILYRMAFGLVLLPQPPFGYAMMQVIWSVLCYPIVVFLSRVVLDLYKPAMGEVDSYGRRL